eukprot:SAG31_NODE_27_length_32731_cov_1443.130393_10_plen_49_part_00
MEGLLVGRGPLVIAEARRVIGVPRWLFFFFFFFFGGGRNRTRVTTIAR